MIERLQILSKDYVDADGHRRLNPIRANFSEIASKHTRRDCRPDYEEDPRLKPRFDIFFGDFGYNTDQLSRVEGLSYLGRELS